MNILPVLDNSVNKLFEEMEFDQLVRASPKLYSRSCEHSFKPLQYILDYFALHEYSHRLLWLLQAHKPDASCSPFSVAFVA